MKRLVLSFLLLGAMAPSNTLLSQKNRISLQQGMFNYFFDEDIPLYNKEKVSNNSYWKAPLFYFGGHFNDSWGFQVQRLLNTKSSLSCEYMFYAALYQPIYTNWTSGPRLQSERRKKINISYNRTVKIRNKWSYNYGAGVNTQWGQDKWYLLSTWNGLEPHYMYYQRNDFGLNVRTGFEYSPIKQITIFSFVDFQSTLFLKYPSDGNEDQFPDFFEQHGDEIKASMFDLSLNFGIGYNF